MYVLVPVMIGEVGVSADSDGVGDKTRGKEMAQQASVGLCG